MSQAVIIKSSKNGINLVLDASMPFPELLTEILHKFTEAERFFANASFAISFEGRELSDEEKYQVVDAIMEQTRVKILCILDSDEIRDAVIEQKCREMQQTNEEKEARRQSRGCFYRGSLLPGERLETEESIVIIGDVPQEAGDTEPHVGGVAQMGQHHGSQTDHRAGDDHEPTYFFHVICLSFALFLLKNSDAIIRHCTGKVKTVTNFTFCGMMGHEL